MKIFKYIPKKISSYIAGVVVLNLLSSCGIWDPADARKVPANVNDRVEKNLEEGRGFRLDTLGQQKGGTFDFASSNELWVLVEGSKNRLICVLPLRISIFFESLLFKVINVFA